MTENSKNEVIFLRRGEVSALSKIFKVSRITVWKATTGRGRSDLTEKIRKAAIERGGIAFKRS